MQIPSAPPPAVTNTLPQDVVAKAVTNIQAMAPLLQKAVAPTPKSEKFNQTRGDKEKSKREEDKESRKENDGKSDHSVNIRV